MCVHFPVAEHFSQFLADLRWLVIPARSRALLWEAGKGGQSGSFEQASCDSLSPPVIVQVSSHHTKQNVIKVMTEPGTLGDRT